VQPVSRNTVDPGERMHSCVTPYIRSVTIRHAIFLVSSQASLGSCLQQLLIILPKTPGRTTKEKPQEHTYQAQAERHTHKTIQKYYAKTPKAE